MKASIDWITLMMGTGEQGTSYFALCLQLHRGMRCQGGTWGFLLIFSLSHAFSYCSYLYSLFPYVLSHMWLSFFPHQTLCHKNWWQVVFFAGEEKKGCDWCVSTPLSVFSPDCFGWVPVSYAGTTVAVSFCLTDRCLWRLCECLFAGAGCAGHAASEALWSPSQAICLIEVCSSRTIGHFKPSHKVCVVPALTSLLPSLLQKGFPVRTYQCYGSFQPLLIPVLEPSGDWVIPQSV